MPPSPTSSAVSIADADGVSYKNEDSVANVVSLPDRQDIIARCELQGWNTCGFAYNEKIWIKYGKHVTKAEVAAQAFAYKHVDQRLFRVPKIYDWFSVADPNLGGLDAHIPKTYIVMETVNGVTYLQYMEEHPNDEAGVFNAIVTAICHIWTFPVPAQALVGPFENEIAINHFFTDRGAERTFKRAIDLQEWRNTKLIVRNRPERVEFTSEPLVFCHIDLHPTNIVIGEDNALYIIDWGMSEVYPLIIENYSLVFKGRVSFGSRLRSALFSSTITPNRRAKAKVALINGQGG